MLIEPKRFLKMPSIRINTQLNEGIIMQVQSCRLNRTFKTDAINTHKQAVERRNVFSNSYR